MAGRQERSTEMADRMLTRMTLAEIEARLAHRTPAEIAESRRLINATTEDALRRQMIEDGYDPDADIPANAQMTVPVRLVREKLGMTQTALAALLRVPVGTLRNWEQNRFTIDPAAQTLLLVLYREPEAVLRALRPAA